MNKDASTTWNRRKSHDMEFAINSRLIQMHDFKEGVDCVVGARKGSSPAWKHDSWEDALNDPMIIELLNIIDSTVL